jgi:hypothetical protein
VRAASIVAESTMPLSINSWRTNSSAEVTRFKWGGGGD